MIDNPELWLDKLDRVADRGPLVLHAFIELLRQAELRAEVPSPKPKPQVIQHLTKIVINGLMHDADFRMRVVRFCFREAIDPVWMIEALLNHEIGGISPADSNRLIELDSDWPVRILCQAYRVFWMNR